MKTIKRPLYPADPRKQLGPNPIGGEGNNSGGVGGAPIAFNASATLTPGQSGVNLDSGTLQSGFRRPVWVDEIRIALLAQRPSVVEDQTGELYGLSGAIGLKFATGKYDFSKTFIPAGLYAPRFQNDYDVDGLSVESAANAAASYYVSYVRWLFPRPLYMPAGDSILASAEYTAYSPFTTAGNVPVDVNVTYVGRDIAPGSTPPNVRNVPYVASVVKNATTAYASYGNAFRNPFMTQWHLQRFTSRSYALFDDDAIEQSFLEDGTFFNNCGTLPGLSVTSEYGYSEVQMYDSIGYDILREWTPIGMVFDTSRAAWTFNRALGPRQQINLNMRHVNGLLTPTSTATFLSHVGLVGYREERV